MRVISGFHSKQCREIRTGILPGSIIAGSFIIGYEPVLTLIFNMHDKNVKQKKKTIISVPHMGNITSVSLVLKECEGLSVKSVLIL